MDGGDYPFTLVDDPQLQKTVGDEGANDTKEKKGGYPWSLPAGKTASLVSGSSTCFTRGQHIYYFAGVSKESIYAMGKQIWGLNDRFDQLQRDHPEVEMVPKPIYLHINSFGGGVFAAFAGIDFIKQSKLPVYTIVEGATASAGTLLSVVGAKRFITPHATMLIHQLSTFLGGKMAAIDDEYTNLQQMMDMIKTIYVEHTSISGDDLDSLLKHDLWWQADKCLETGLVDAVWQGTDPSKL